VVAEDRLGFLSQCNTDVFILELSMFCSVEKRGNQWGKIPIRNERSSSEALLYTRKKNYLEDTL